MIERAVALAVLVACGVYLVNGWTLTLGTIARPGPGFYPLAVGVFGAAVSIAWVVTTFRRAPAVAGARAAPVIQDRWRVGVTASLLVAFCWLLPPVGYPLAAFFFSGLLLLGLGARWKAALVIALACAVLSYYLFAILLGVPLPRGPLLE
ncbi:MAG TPA: tripartite tricarboxylate transporter TctB family protein [Methylomirabilota bacterium]|jgi:putative tricarboxylic transport membrane protein